VGLQASALASAMPCLLCHTVHTCPRIADSYSLSDLEIFVTSPTPACILSPLTLFHFVTSTQQGTSCAR
jgi:hypothetical protein